jgi:YVTN family beta-propeller protein
MKRTVVLCFVFAGLAAGQWLEATIQLPDSLGQPNNLQCSAYDSIRGIVYFGAAEGRCLVAVDAARLRVIARIPAGPNVRALCCNEAAGKVYAADLGNNTVTIIDAETRTVLRRLAVPAQPVALCLNPARNLVYVACYSGTVAAIDGAVDTIVARVTGLASAYALCVNPAGTRLYVARNNTSLVTVVNCSTNAVVRSVTTSSGPCALVYNGTDDKVYAACYGNNQLAIIDATRDSLRALLPTGEGPVALCWNSVSDKVYCGVEDGETLLVVDGVGDTVLPGPPNQAATSFAYAASLNRVFVGGEDEPLLILDGTTDTILASGPNAAALSYAAGRGLVFYSMYDGVGAADDSLAGRWLVTGTPFDLAGACWSSASEKLYCPSTYADAVAVVDGATLAPTRLLWGLEGAGPTCWVPPADMLFIGGNDGFRGGPALFPLDCATDSVGPPIHLPELVGELAWGSVGNRVYAAAPDADTLFVIDVSADSLVATLALPARPTALCYVETHDRLYCYGQHVLSSVDCESLRVDSLYGGGSYFGGLAYLGLPADRLYIVSSVDSMIHVIDAAQNRYVRAVPGPRLRGLACVDAARGLLYCATDYDSLAILDCSSDSFIGGISMPVGIVPTVLQYDSVNNRIYCGSSVSGYVAVLDCATRNVVTIIHTGSPVALAWDPVRLRTFVANRDEATVSVIRDSLRVGVTEAPGVERGMGEARATVVRGVLRLPESDLLSGASSVLLDATGRKVLDLRPGENDVSRLATGVYFVRKSPGGQAIGRSVEKVVVAR